MHILRDILCAWQVLGCLCVASLAGGVAVLAVCVCVVFSKIV